MEGDIQFLQYVHIWSDTRSSNASPGYEGLNSDRILTLWRKMDPYSCKFSFALTFGDQISFVFQGHCFDYDSVWFVDFIESLFRW